MTELTIHTLNQQYGKEGHFAVQNLSLAMESGKITALLGPSGCGKTTTLKMIAGLLAPTSGDIRFDGNSVLETAAEKRGAVMVFQNHLLFPHMNVIDNVAFGLQMQKMPKADRHRKANEMLDLVQLSGLKDRRPDQLSGGQRQRVALARALVVEPRVLLLDEPLSNLDAHLRDEMRSLILRIQKETGVTTVVVTHDQEEAVVLAHKIALMFDGRLAQYAQPRAFYSRPSSPQVATFFGCHNLISGNLAGGKFVSPLGDFVMEQMISPTNIDTLTIRPEEIVVGQDGANSVNLQIEEIVYLGNYSRIHAVHAESGIRLTAHCSADTSAQYKAGQSIWFHLPSQKAWGMTK